jgi:hypothetical protein
MVALYALWYNFVRIHKTLRVHPGDGARDRGSVVVDGGRGCADRWTRRAARAQARGSLGGVSLREFPLEKLSLILAVERDLKPNAGVSLCNRLKRDRLDLTVGPTTYGSRS